MYFSGWDEDKTKRNVKSLLKGRRQMKVRLLKLKLDASLSSVQYDGMPKSETNRNSTENSMIAEIQKVQEEREELTWIVTCIDKTIDMMSSVDDRGQYLATILEYRFIKDWSVNKCCLKVSELDYVKENYDYGDEQMPTPTFFDHQNEALLTFAELYPNQSAVVVKKSIPNP